MSNIKKYMLTMILMIIALVVFIPTQVNARTLSIGDNLKISENDMSAANDLYCVAYGKSFGGINGMNYKFDFKVRAYVKITGKHAEGTTASGQTISIDNDANATMAAILGGPLTRGYGKYNNYNEAQKALYTYWNSWVASVGGSYGFSGDSANDQVNGSIYVQEAQAAAAEKDYEATIYLLAPVGDALASNVQELIAVDAPDTPDTPNPPTPDNPPSQPTTVTGYVNISGYVWEDMANNKKNEVNSKYDEGEQRLQGIKVHWKDADGNEIASTETGDDGSYKLQTTLELYNHPYSIKDKEKYDRINNSHIEFEYNGYKYTTVAYKGNLSDTVSSKGKENEEDRISLDNKFDRVENSSIYDGDNAFVTGLPKTTITDANYSSEFAVSASTGNIVRRLLNIAETNSWTNKRTFCTEHCTAAPHTHLIATKEIDRKVNAKPIEKTRILTDSTGKPIINSETGEPVTEKYTEYEDAVLYVKIYCFGDSTTADFSGDTTYFNLGSYSIKAPKGNEFNSYDGVHYYSADEIDGPTTRDCKKGEEKIYEWNIQNMNLGLVRREQPDAALTSDIEKVRVIMKNQEYTYIYGNRGIQNNEELFDYKVKFENKYIEQKYSRPVNPADIAYVNYNTSDELKVYVTYNIIVKNQSDTLPMTINKIVNYFDSNYTIYTGDRSVTATGWIEAGGNNNGYKIAYYNTPINLQPGTKSDIIRIEFEISQSAIKGLLNNDATLNNVSEIFSFTTQYGENTICAERETALTKGKVGQQYAGLDKDSTPGTAIPGNKDTYEDDTDKAPSFLLMKDPNYKTMTGIVYEDQQTKESADASERLGNGIKDGNEKGVEGVKVELLNADGTPAYLYYKTAQGTADRKLAVTYSDAEGNYSFGSAEESGIVVDNYIVKYTYGNADGLKTTIDGGNTVINARNYKSTIITESNVKEVMQGNNSDKWHLYMDENTDVSIAVDDVNQRLAIPSLKYSNYNDSVNMSAYSKPFKVQVEYTQEQQANVSENGGDFAHDWSVFDFGIIERPRENIVINKNISRIKVTLANGQILIDGDPRTEKLNYVKAPGLTQKTDANGREVAQYSPTDRLLSIEIDQELIQGATLEVWYAITATNYSEIDYDYEQGTGYYFYGDNSGLDVIKQSVEKVADYMSSKMVCNVGDDSPNMENIDNKEWTVYNADSLKDEGLISAKDSTNTEDTDKTYETLKTNGLQVFTTETFKDLEPNGGTKTSTIYASRQLANQEENHLYENHVEILQINGKIARTIKEVDNNRAQVSKEYQPGNYIPTLSSEHQQDDDRVRIVITPPTGTTTYFTTYLIAGLIGLFMVAEIIYFTKKVFRLR